MNPVVSAVIGSLIRMALVAAGVNGVEVGNEEISKAIDAALVLGSIIWSIVHKVQVDQQIKKAQSGLL